MSLTPLGLIPLGIIPLGINAIVAFTPAPQVPALVIGTHPLLSQTAPRLPPPRLPPHRLLPDPMVRAQYALRAYIHPQIVSNLREEQGTTATSYRWRGVYTVDPQDPKIVAELKSVNNPYYSPGMAGVTLYERQVEAAGHKPHSRMGGMFTYEIKDEQGKVWSVVVRGDDDFHPADSTEFTVFISVPGG
jgi:hypothetical protein